MRQKEKREKERITQNKKNMQNKGTKEMREFFLELDGDRRRMLLYFPGKRIHAREPQLLFESCNLFLITGPLVLVRIM